MTRHGDRPLQHSAEGGAAGFQGFAGLLRYGWGFGLADRDGGQKADDECGGVGHGGTLDLGKDERLWAFPVAETLGSFRPGIQKLLTLNFVCSYFKKYFS